MANSFAQYGPGREEFPANISDGILKRNATNDGWEQLAPKDILSGALGNIDVNGQKLTNLGTPTNPSDAATLAYANSVGVGSVLFGTFKQVATGLSLGTSATLSLADALFAGYSPGGSTAGEGIAGIICGSFANSADETGTGSGQGGLGSVGSLLQPYNTTDFPGQHVSVQFARVDGSALLLSDLMTSPPSGQEGQKVEGYLSYRSDLGADSKWRLWFYYQRASDGLSVSFTPDKAASASLYVPLVDSLANLPVGFAMGEVSGTPGSTKLPMGQTSDIQAVGQSNAAGSSGKVADASHVHDHGQQPAGSNGGLAHALADATHNGFLSADGFNKLAGLPSSAVSTDTAVFAGDGLTGGGDLSTSRTLSVGANADGSIRVNANDIQVGTLATDAQHGDRGGGSLHAVATTGAAGFMSSTDKAKLDSLSSSSFNVSIQTTNAVPAELPALALGDLKSVTIQTVISAHKSDSTAAAGITIFGVFRRSGSTLTQVGPTRVVAFNQDPGFNVDASYTISGTTVNVEVTGLASTTIDWRATGNLSISP